MAHPMHAHMPRVAPMARPSWWTAHPPDWGSSASAPRLARQSPGQRQKPSRSKDGSWLRPPDRGNTRRVHRPKPSFGEVLIPSKRLIRDFVHRLDAYVSSRSLIPAKPPLESVLGGCFMDSIKP